MRWGDVTRSVLFPVAVPALVSFLWFASWAGAFAAHADQGWLPPLNATDVDDLKADVDAGHGPTPSLAAAAR